jgi:dTDP-4-dehydrorhamnose 3,5-epimerase
MTKSWLVPGAVRDVQSVTNDGESVGKTIIEGVLVRQVNQVLKHNGSLIELFRRDWFSGITEVDQVFQVRLEGGAISAWHAHEDATDRLFVTAGTMRIVLYDGRVGSPTYGGVNEWLAGSRRPLLIVVPPKVWHGVQNVTAKPATILNLPDHAYRYAEPDHWRVPVDTDQIPYRFPKLSGARV